MKKSILLILIIVLILGGSVFYYYYDQIYEPVINAKLSNQELKIKTGSTFEDVVFQLKQNKQLIKEKSFRWLANKMQYNDKSVRPGRYLLHAGMSNILLVRQLRSGNQTPVKVVIYEGRTPDEIIQKADDDIEPNTAELLDTLYSETFLRSINRTKDNAMCIFIPNTYEVYWNISAKNFLLKMKQEADKFWTKNNRLSKARTKGLTPDEVYTMASIVEKETNHAPEKPTIASVYLNRLTKGMRLQADPTVVFAKKAFSIQRVLFSDLTFKSPYNTYLNDGLPPGPISIASIESIDAVLNAPETDFIFFCVKPGYTGEHNFAATSAQHSANARKFHDWMNAEKIK
ncbi:MAG: endolytic transglycosylase MltG [Saprospiraceae bacterium]